MSIEALREMKEQFENGVSYLPTHGENEWNDVIGKTIGAEIYRDNSLVEQNESEEGYSLHVRVVLYKTEELSKKLYNRLNRGEKVGMSIGGYFREVEVVENSEGDVERVIINSLSLDHLATTRNPSNPDSYISEIKRHIQYVKEEEDGYVVKFGKSEKVEGEDMVENSKSGIKQEIIGEVKEEQYVVNNQCEAEKTCPVCYPEFDKPEINLHNSIKDARRSVDNNQNLDMELSMSERETHSENKVEEQVTKVADTRSHSEEKISTLETKIVSLERSLTTLVNALAEKQEQKETQERELVEKSKDDKINFLEERVKALTEKVVRVAQPVRRSVISRGGDKSSFEVKTAYSTAIERAKQELGENSALAAVAQDQLERRSAPRKEAATFHELENDLVSVIRAAVADGVIVPPTQRNNWK